VTELAVTDTHALLWYATKTWRKLGHHAKALFERADAGRAAIFVPTIVLVEVLEAEYRGAVRLSGGASEWIEGLLASGKFLPADLTPEVVLRAHSLYLIPERGDRLVAATAVSLGLPLITRDPEIAAAAAVDLVW
jgi:PIN domain nuclease of toxin-antitoxin system